MAKGQMRSSREAKKPKKAKLKAPIAGASASLAPAKPDAAARGGKKS